MLQIEQKTYKIFAEKLMSEIMDKEYYRGTIEVDSRELYAELRGTFLIYREPLWDYTDITNSATQITDIVPVWWEFRTFQECGEVYNTFSWREFKSYLA